MLVKMGVKYGDENIKRPMRRTLDLIDETFIKHHGQEAVLSSTDEGDHRPNSLHHAGLACDFRVRHLDLSQRDTLKVMVRNALISRFGDRKYDVLFSPDRDYQDACLHVEYDPK